MNVNIMWNQGYHQIVIKVIMRAIERDRDRPGCAGHLEV